jgi:PadR family transcriptional regulator, regulatory protein PadR
MASAKVRLSNQGLKALHLLLSKRAEPLSGAAIARETQIGSGTLYPLLARLEEAGWLTSEWEAIDPREAARPRRRFYKLTAYGASSAQSELRKLSIPAEGALAWTS